MAVCDPSVCMTMCLCVVPVQLTVLGSPAEEGGGGKVPLIEAHVFDDVDVALMAHPAPFHDTRIEMLARLG